MEIKVTNNEKLAIMYLSVSKETYWETYSNQDKWKKESKM